MKQIFEGHLTLDHMATHVAHHFTVPKGVGTLRFSFSYDPHHPGGRGLSLTSLVYPYTGPTVRAGHATTTKIKAR